MTDQERIISVVGTTSGGKSTLLNAIIGQWLLPTGVQETTQVATRIGFHRQPRRWTVDRAGHTTQYADEGSLRSALRTERPGRDAISISAPRRASNSALLPFVTSKFIRGRAGVSLQDLPGIVSQSDDVHLALQRRILRESHVVVVVLNALEPNEVKTQQVVDLVTRGALSSGVRCVWVLGRVDECMTDDHDRERLAARRVALTESIWTARGKRPRIHPVSARAALLASLVLRSTALRPADLEVIQRWLARDVSTLAPDLKLPRTPPPAWSTALRFRVARRLWRASGVSSLDRALGKAVR